MELRDICNYIDYLTENCGLYVTVHGAFTSVPELARYNFHLNPYCCYIKTVTGNWNICIQKQRKIMQKEESFFGVCHAGAGEFVYPVKVNGKNIGFVSVGSFLLDTKEAKQKTAHFAFKNSVDENELFRLQKEFLKKDIPEKEKIDTLINPLVFMLESVMQKYRQFEFYCADDDLFTKLLRIVTSEHNTRITMKELSGRLNCSVSTLSHLFKKRTGLGITEYVEKLRLQDARWLLKQSGYSVTEIADILGFCNPGHFSSAFKRKYGVSPNRYRKE